MRALFVSTPGLGHLFPMVPLAWALRSAGHEVMVATSGQGLTAARSGLPVVDVAPGFDRRTMMARLQRDDPALAARLRRLRGRRLTDLREAAEFAACTSMPLVDRTVTLARRWRPDLVVQSQLQGAGLVAAGVLDLPLIDHGFGLARTYGMAALHRVHMGEAFTRYGIGVPENIATIDVAPPSMVDGSQGDGRCGKSHTTADTRLLTSRIGNPYLSRLESGFPVITESPDDQDYLPHGSVLGRTATQLAGQLLSRTTSRMKGIGR